MPVTNYVARLLAVIATPDDNATDGAWTSEPCSDHLQTMTAPLPPKQAHWNSKERALQFPPRVGDYASIAAPLA
jgi:hypothetical protein